MELSKGLLGEWWVSLIKIFKSRSVVKSLSCHFDLFVVVPLRLRTFEFITMLSLISLNSSLLLNGGMDIYFFYLKYENKLKANPDLFSALYWLEFIQKIKNRFTTFIYFCDWVTWWGYVWNIKFIHKIFE